MAINSAEFREALNQIEVARGISKEVIVKSLIEAMTKGYRKELGGDDALVEVNIDAEAGTIEMYHMKNIVQEVEDDFLEIEEKEAKALAKEGKGFIKDNIYYVEASIEELRKATAMSIKSILRQKFAEAEKDVLYEAFKDKINTMITGRVEKIDERGASVNIGRTSVYLPRKQMIGDERFSLGDQIRLFVSDVASDMK
ncbi:MAG: NusA N-terminal domain-containing protein, partial [Bacilli bacterium]|nr:NusA N-terminal domain-containing protein [Bacilli bacterium]